MKKAHTRSSSTADVAAGLEGQQIDSLCRHVVAFSRQLRQQDPGRVLQTAQGKCEELLQELQKLQELLDTQRSRHEAGRSAQTEARDRAGSRPRLAAVMGTQHEVDLQLQLEDIKLSFQDTVQHCEVLQQSLDKEIRSHVEDFDLFKSVMDEQAVTLQKMEEEMVVLQKESLMQQKHLLRELQGLKEAHGASQEKLKREVQAEKDKTVALCQQLDHIRASHQELSQRCDVLQQQLDSHEEDLLRQEPPVPRVTSQERRETALLRSKLETITASHEQLSQQCQLLQRRLDSETQLHQEDLRVIASLRLEQEASRLRTEEKQASLLRELRQLKEVQLTADEIQAEKEELSLFCQKLEAISSSHREVSQLCDVLQQRLGGRIRREVLLAS